jgi:hypothetical protein
MIITYFFCGPESQLSIVGITTQHILPPTYAKVQQKEHQKLSAIGNTQRESVHL